MGDPTAVKVGPGLLYIAPLLSTIPTDLTTPWATVDSDWTALGYTEEGHSFSYEPNFEAIEVAEELDPIRYEQTGRQMTVAFAAAEMTATNISRAMNGGTITSGAGIVTFTPPAIGSVTKVMLGWESQDGEERWVWKQCVQTGSVEVARRKAPDKATVPMSFQVEKPSAGGDPFVAIFAV